MARCVFCCEEKEKLTDEHMIPAALGSNVFLRKASCEECQRICNKSFEQRFLKGSNFVALIRAQLGIKGRRNEPVFGFDQHGHPLTVEVQPGFPAIRLGLASNGLYRPAQLVLADGARNVLDYIFLPDAIKRPVTTQLFDDLVEEVPPDTSVAAFWADGDLTPANVWRELLESFVAWANRSSLTAIASSVAAGEAKASFTVDWTAEYRDRGLAKIGFMYMLTVVAESDRYDGAFKAIRQYVLNGSYTGFAWNHGPVLQWSGAMPALAPDLTFTYLLATVTRGRDVFGLVHLLNMGLFCVKLATLEEPGLVPDRLTIYRLEKGDSDAYVMHSDLQSAEATRSFADAVRMSDLLCA